MESFIEIIRDQTTACTAEMDRILLEIVRDQTTAYTAEMNRNTSDGVVWKAYRFDKQGKCSEKEWDLKEDTGNHFCWYHGKLPNGNQTLSSFEEIFIKKLCPPLKHRDITRMVSGGPFCDHVDGALFLRVNSSGSSLRYFEFRLAARITKNSMITMSVGPNLDLGVFPENQNLVRNDEMVELDEIVIEKGDGPKNSNQVRNKEKRVAAKNGIEEGDVESRLEMNEEEADNPLVTIIGSLLIHIVKRHVDCLQEVVTELEIDLDTIENSMAWLGLRIEALTETDEWRKAWDDTRLTQLHFKLQRLLQVIAHVEQVYPCIKEKCTKKRWLAAADNASLEEVIGHLRKLKENVRFICSRVRVIQAGYDRTQAALDSNQATQINKKLYYLSILSVIFLPLSFITGIFGLSVGGIPWTDHKDGFRNVLLTCVVMTVVLLACRTIRVLYRRIKKMLLREQMRGFMRRVRHLHGLTR